MRRLADLLGIELAHAVGIMEMIWHSAGQETPRGDIGTAKDREIAAWCDWRKKPTVLVEALIEAGWLDRNDEYRLIVHDWPEHAEQAVKKWLERRKEFFLECYAEKPPRVRTVSGQSLDEDRTDGSPRAGARALASDLAGASVSSDSVSGKNSEPRARVNIPARRNGVTDEQWPIFLDEAIAHGMKGSEVDWDNASWEWGKLDIGERMAAIQGLPRDLVGKENCLPVNYLRKKMWQRPERRASPTGGESAVLRIMREREAEDVESKAKS